MPADPTPTAACCACLTVTYDPERHDDGSLSERWACVLCGVRFVRVVALDSARAESAERIAALEAERDDIARSEASMVAEDRSRRIAMGLSLGLAFREDEPTSWGRIIRGLVAVVKESGEARADLDEVHTWLALGCTPAESYRPRNAAAISRVDAQLAAMREGREEDRKRIAIFLRSFESTSYDLTLTDFAESIETGAFEALFEGGSLPSPAAPPVTGPRCDLHGGADCPKCHETPAPGVICSCGWSRTYAPPVAVEVSPPVAGLTGPAEAIQWDGTPETLAAIRQWHPPAYVAEADPHVLRMPEADGYVSLSVGDWVARKADGRLSVILPPTGGAS